MRVVGVNLSHDYAHAVLGDEGAWIFEAERTSRVRHGALGGIFDLRCLDDYSDEWLGDVSLLALCSPHPEKISEWGTLGESPTVRNYSYVGRNLSHTDEAVEGKVVIDGSLEIPALICSHYHAHALDACLESGLDSAAVLAVDGGGDFGEGAIFDYSRDCGLGLRERLMATQIGSAYHHFALEYFGVDEGFLESRLMAVAALGTPALSCVDGMSSNGRRTPLHPDYRLTVHDVAAFQSGFEAQMLGLAERASEASAHASLVLTGGCALNVLANAAIANSGLFRQVFVSSRAGDMGTAMGAALMGADRIDLPISREMLTTPFLGSPAAFDVKALASALESRGHMLELQYLPDRPQTL